MCVKKDEIKLVRTKRGDVLNPKELEYLTYQKIKIQQLLDDLNFKENYFSDIKV